MSDYDPNRLERHGSVESCEQLKYIPAFQVPRVSARTLVGPASVHNQGAVDWGAHGLLAYGSNALVVLVDTRNVQHVQTLEKHKAPVQQVSWEPQNMASSSSALGLVSCDAQGVIVVWDVESGQAKGTMQDGNKPVLEVSWVPGSNSQFLFLALHPPYSLILWDPRCMSRLWKKTYTENLLTFSLDPFDRSKLAFLCQECILLVDDFSVSRIPSSNGRKLYVSSPQSGGNNTNTPPEKNKPAGGDSLTRFVKDFVTGETRPRPEDTQSLPVAEVLQLRHHQALRNHLLLLYPKEILILDLHINHTVGVLPLERSASPFMQVISCRQRDAFYFLHESGSVSVKSRRPPIPCMSTTDQPHSLGLDTALIDNQITYESRCHSEVLRLHKNARILGMAADPISERRIGLVLSTGRVVFLELGHVPLCPLSPRHLSHLVDPLYSDQHSTKPPLRLQVTGLLYCVASPLLVIRMCPALTTRNWQTYEPLMAGGTESGAVQIFNMSSGMLEKELLVHSYPVRGIEWTSLKSFLSFGYSNPGTSGVMRNELASTDVQTGGSTLLRSDITDESPIDFIRISPLKQYFVLGFKFNVFELWDLRNLCSLRTMPKKFPLVTALEWSPIHNLKALRRKLADQEEKEQEESAVVSPLATNPETGRPEINEKQIVAREHFVFTDTESQLFHFSVEGNFLKDGIKIPPEPGVGGVTCIAFKNDLIVQGDSDGLLNIWDLKARSSRNVHTGRGTVRKMRFAPGKGNFRLLLLYNDGVDIIDLKKQKYERMAQLRSPRDIVKVLDVDWAASDKPVLATQDGCLRIMDSTLTSANSGLADYVYHDPVFCPALVSPAALLTLRTSLAVNLCFPPNLEGLRGLTDMENQILRDQVSQLSSAELAALEQGSVLTRALAAARMFGCREEVDLWTIAIYYLQYYKEKHVEGSPRLESPCSHLETNRINEHPHLEPLDTAFDLLMDPYNYQRMQLERAFLHQACRVDYAHTKRVVDRLIVLGQTDRAVQLLLETEVANPTYYTDAIKACLVATMQSSGAAQSTIKLVATNLIANNNVWEGVQLLCLIGKGLDACRYLTSYGLWNRAAWLAKSVLPEGERDEVLRKWADHLAVQGDRVAGALVMLTLGRFSQAVAFLAAAGLPVQAHLLLLACKEEEVPVEPPTELHEEIRQLFDGNTNLLEALGF